MRRHIRLSDLGHVPTPRHKEYSGDLMETARAAMVERGLRWDNALGRMRDNRDGELERYVRQSDHVPHTCADDVMAWEFGRYIANSASRMSRGHTP